MFSLLLSTLAMMGMTFIIGFFVAAVIKIIANWADFFAFYNLHKNEISDLKKEYHHGVGVTPAQQATPEKYEKLVHGISETINGLKPRKRITA